LSDETETPSTTSRALVKAGGNVGALIPQDFDQAYRLSRAIAASGMAPKGMNSPEQVLVAIMYGAELDMAPMQALQSVAVINGRPTLWGDGLLALVLRQGVDVNERMEGEGDERVCICSATRPDTGKTGEQRFSVNDAKKAGLWTKDGPWKTYPERMLKMRARAWCLRDLCADMLRGVQVREEIEDTVEVVPPPVSGLATRLQEQRHAPEGFSQDGVTKTLNGEQDAPAEIVDAEVEEIAVEDLGLKTGADLLAEQEATTVEDEQTQAADTEGVTAGHARPNEVYFLDGETFNTKDKRQSYKDGRPFSMLGPRASIPVYAEHAPIVGQAAPVERVDQGSQLEPASIRDNPEDRTEVADESAEGEPTTSKSPASSDDSPALDDEAEFEDITDPFVLFDENVGELGSWAEIKASLAALRKSPAWVDATKGQVHGAYRMAWLAAKALMDAGRGSVDPGADPTLFLCWLTTAKDADEVDGTLKLVLMKSPAWKALSEVQQESVQRQADEAKAALNG